MALRIRDHDRGEYADGKDYRQADTQDSSHFASISQLEFCRKGVKARLSRAAENTEMDSSRTLMGACLQGAILALQRGSPDSRTIS
jgi:hypothetical protein